METKTQTVIAFRTPRSGLLFGTMVLLLLLCLYSPRRWTDCGQSHGSPPPRDPCFVGEQKIWVGPISCNTRISTTDWCQLGLEMLVIVGIALVLGPCLRGPIWEIVEMPIPPPEPPEPPDIRRRRHRRNLTVLVTGTALTIMCLVVFFRDEEPMDTSLLASQPVEDRQPSPRRPAVVALHLLWGGKRDGAYRHGCSNEQVTELLPVAVAVEEGLAHGARPDGSTLQLYLQYLERLALVNRGGEALRKERRLIDTELARLPTQGRSPEIYIIHECAGLMVRHIHLCRDPLALRETALRPFDEAPLIASLRASLIDNGRVYFTFIEQLRRDENPQVQLTPFDHLFLRPQQTRNDILRRTTALLAYADRVAAGENPPTPGDEPISFRKLVLSRNLTGNYWVSRGNPAHLIYVNRRLTSRLRMLQLHAGLRMQELRDGHLPATLNALADEFPRPLSALDGSAISWDSQSRETSIKFGKDDGMRLKPN